jgi:lipoprotein-releasing system permease protein
MSFESFIALRYLLARRKQAFISVISLMSVLGVAIGVAALIVVLGVMNGMSKDLRDKILGVNAHLIVGSLEAGIRDYQGLADEALKVPGVLGATPFIYAEVMVSTRQGSKGVVLRGIDPASAGSVLSVGRDMVEGSLEDLNGGFGPAGGPPGILVGLELANRLGVRRGSLLHVLTPSGRSTAAGFTPEVVTARVAGVFKTGMWEYDSSLAYASLAETQRLMGFSSDLVTGVEMRVADVDRADAVGRELAARIGGYPLYVRDWKEMNRSLYEALALEKAGITVILVMIVLVGTFSIVTSLVMLVMEKTRDIAILMSMGARRRSIRRIFMLQGTLIGAMGTGLGFTLGLSLCLLLKKYQFIRLPKGIYSLDYLPVLLNWVDLTAIGVGAMLLCFLATIYPARQAARLMPAEALRYE